MDFDIYTVGVGRGLIGGGERGGDASCVKSASGGEAIIIRFIKPKHSDLQRLFGA